MVEGLRKVLAESQDLVFAGSVSKVGDVQEAIYRLRPNVALIDLSAGLSSALRLVANLKSSAPACFTALWVVELPEMDAFRALQMGARGIIKKTLPVSKLVEGLREVGGGKVWMNDAEHVSAFLHRKEASRLTQGTVKVHLMHIFEKTGLQDRLALAVHGGELVGTDSAQIYQPGTRTQAAPSS